MPDCHLTTDQIARCQGFMLTPEEIPDVYAHLELCPECRNLVAVGRPENSLYEGVGAVLLLSELTDRKGLSNERIAAYVDGSLAPAERDCVDVYLERSAAARIEIRQAQSFRNLLTSLPAREVAPSPPVILNDATGPVLLERTGNLTSAGWAGLPDDLAAWAREIITQGIARPVDSVRTALESMHRIAAPVLRHAPDRLTPEPLSPTFTAIRSTSPLLRWQGVPNAQEYVVVLARQTHGANRAVVWKQSAGPQTEIVLSAEVALEPGSAYLWQVTATVSGQSLRSPFAWFLTLSEADLQAVRSGEQDCGASLLARLGALETYGLYEEALALMPTLAALNPDSPLAGMIQEQLHKRFEHTAERP